MDKLTILVIDDNDDCNKLVKLIIQQDTNWRILTASNGKDGIELVKLHRPEVILLDLAMPQMDGIEVYEILNSQFENYFFVVIFFTAMPRISSKIKDAIARDIEIISKPFNIMSLVDRITKIWNKARQRESFSLSK